MSEPQTKADRVHVVVPGVWNWHVLDDRIGDFRSDAHAIRGPDGEVFIDPLPTTPAALDELGPIVAVCLTAACHQRSAWRLRREHDVEVYAPDGSRDMDEEPDVRYTAGDVLPGGLRAVHTPGPESAHYALLREGNPGVLFCADLLMRPEGSGLVFVPPEYHEDPDATRNSVRQLLDLEFSVLCLAHGPPITSDPHAALRQVLQESRAATA